jgi:hypothetical protein
LSSTMASFVSGTYVRILSTLCEPKIIQVSPIFS